MPLRKPGAAAAYVRAWRAKHPERYMVERCRAQAAKKGVAFDLDSEEARAELRRRVAVGVCEVSGYPLVVLPPSRHNEKRPDAASIDRRDPSKGYTLDNIRVVCLAVNLALNVWGEQAFLPILKRWAAA